MDEPLIKCAFCGWTIEPQYRTKQGRIREGHAALVAHVHHKHPLWFKNVNRQWWEGTLDIRRAEQQAGVTGTNP